MDIMQSNIDEYSRHPICIVQLPSLAKAKRCGNLYFISYTTSNFSNINLYISLEKRASEDYMFKKLSFSSKCLK